jgi:hypothetical protein
MFVKTYLNGLGNPIIRKCSNCRFWDNLNNETGYCTKLPLQFAYSLLPSNYALSKKHNLCDKHVLENEDTLQKEATPAQYDAAYLKRKKQ